MIPLFRVYIAPDALERVGKVFDSGYVGQGTECDRFEYEFGEAIDSPVPPLALNSGTSALHLALHLAGVGPGDRVITSPMTCLASHTEIIHRGAIPVWADVDPVTGLVDWEDVSRKLTRQTKAILAIDWAGRACDYDSLNRMGVPVIEDAAHAMLARYQYRSIARTGGHYLCYSTQAIKHITTIDGGFLIVPPEQWERARKLRWYGLDRTQSASMRCLQDVSEIGYKFHLSDVLATIGRAALPHLGKIVARHRQNAAYYYDRLEGLPGITVPPYDPGCSYWLFTIHVPDRDTFEPFMAKRGIAVSRVHARTDTHSAFQDYWDSDLPGVNQFDSTQTNLPCGWWVSDADRENIAGAVEEWAEVCQHRMLES